MYLAKGMSHLVGESTSNNHTVELVEARPENDDEAIKMVMRGPTVHHFDIAASKQGRSSQARRNHDEPSSIDRHSSNLKISRTPLPPGEEADGAPPEAAAEDDGGSPKIYVDIVEAIQVCRKREEVRLRRATAFTGEGTPQLRASSASRSLFLVWKRF